MEKSIYVLNVFSNDGIRGGNQLAVILDAGDLTQDQMQTVTRQMNYSESTFVTSETHEAISFKIFIPTSEIPYAGHPTIGTCYLLEYLSRKNGTPHKERIVAKLLGGDIPVKYREENSSMIVYMDQLPVKYFGNSEKVDELIDALGLKREQLLSDLSPIYAPSSLKFIVICVQTEDILDAVLPNFATLSNILEDDESILLLSPSESSDFAMRMFAPRQGIMEDPATGSAQGAVVHALRDFNLLNHNSVEIIQGKAMGRPSILYNQIERRNTEELLVKTGGNCSIIISGTIIFD